MSLEKRCKIRIYFDVLRILSREMEDGKPRLTKVARLSNLPFDRFQKCLNQLVQLGLVSYAEGKKIFVTEKGLKFIDEYLRFDNFLKEIGLSF